MNIDRSETKRKQKWESQGTHLSRMEIFRWRWRNGMNKMANDEEGLICHYQRLDGPKHHSPGAPPKKSAPFASIWKNLKSWKAEISTHTTLSSHHIGELVQQINQVKD